MLLLVIITAVLSHFIMQKDYHVIADFSVPLKQGQYIHNNALPGEAVFISKDTASDFFAEYYLAFLSDRNLRYADSENDAIKIAQQLGKTKVVFFDLNTDTSLIRANHLRIFKLSKQQKLTLTQFVWILNLFLHF